VFFSPRPSPHISRHITVTLGAEVVIRCELAPTRIIGMWVKVIGPFLQLKIQVKMADIYCSETIQLYIKIKLV
jgi:hypothetical protein